MQYSIRSTRYYLDVCLGHTYGGVRGMGKLKKKGSKKKGFLCVTSRRTRADDGWDYYNCDVHQTQENSSGFSATICL